MLVFVHGELLIEMEDNVYCKSNDRLFSIIAFLHVRGYLYGNSTVSFYQTPFTYERCSYVHFFNHHSSMDVSLGYFYLFQRGETS
jgi:hypothetical protein